MVHVPFTDLLKKIKLKNSKNKRCPLYQYDVEEVDYNNLFERLKWEKNNVVKGDSASKYVSASFVLWASIYIREKIEDISSKNLFNALEITENERGRKLTKKNINDLVNQLIEAGLEEWLIFIERERYKSFLYYLVVQSGFPFSQMKKGNLNSLFKKLIHLFESRAKHSSIPSFDHIKKDFKKNIKAAPISDLYVNDETAKLFYDMIKEIYRLRDQALMYDVSAENIYAWLDSRNKNWYKDFPIKIPLDKKDDFIDFIKDPLNAERKYERRIQSTDQFIYRGLTYDEERNIWRSLCFIKNYGFLEYSLFSEKVEVGDTLEIIGFPDELDAFVDRLVTDNNKKYSIRLEQNSNDLIGKNFSLNKSISVKVYNQGEFFIENNILPALGGAPSFWTYENKEEDDEDDKADLIESSPQTNFHFIFCLTNQSEPPFTDGTIIIKNRDKKQEVSCGEDHEIKKYLWQLRGTGFIEADGYRFKVQTNSATHHYKNISIILRGNELSGKWYPDQGEDIFKGEPKEVLLSYDDQEPFNIYKNSDNKFYYKLREGKLSTIIDVYEKESETIIKNIQIQTIPEEVDIKAYEVSEHSEEIECLVSGLPGNENEFEIEAVARCIKETEFYDNKVKLSYENGKYSGSLSSEEENPGELSLIIRDSRKVSFEKPIQLILNTPWPWKTSFFIDKTYRRLTRRKTIFVDQLDNFRIINPNNDNILVNIKIPNKRGNQEGHFLRRSRSTLDKSFITQILAQNEKLIDSSLEIYLDSNKKDLLEVKYCRPEDFYSEIEVKEAIENGTLKIFAFMIDLEEAYTYEEEWPIDKLVRDITEDIIDKLQQERKIEDILLKEILSLGTWMIILMKDGEPLRPRKPEYIGNQKNDIGNTREKRIQYYKDLWETRLKRGSYKELRYYWQVIEKALDKKIASAFDEIQALAHCPQAILTMMLIFEEYKIDMIIDLNQVIPIFWSSVPISAFKSSISYAKNILKHTQYILFREGYSEFSNDKDIDNHIKDKVYERIELIIEKMPFCRLHWGRVFSNKKREYRSALKFKNKLARNIDSDVITLLQLKEEVPSVYIPSDLVEELYRDFVSYLHINISSINLSKKKNILIAPLFCAKLTLEEIELDDNKKIYIQSALLLLRKYNIDYFDTILGLFIL